MILRSHQRKDQGESTIFIFGIVFVGILVALGIFAGAMFFRLIDRVILDMLIKPSALDVQREMHIHLVEQDRLLDSLDPMSAAHFDAFVDEIKDIGDVRRVDIFTKDKVRAFSTAGKGIGEISSDPAIEQALRGDVVVTEPSDAAVGFDTTAGNDIELHIPFSTVSGGVQGIVSIHMNEMALAAFRKQLYILIALLGISSAMLIVIIIYVGLRSQAKIIKQQAKDLSTIVEKAPVGIYIINKKGIIEVFNSKMVELAGEKSMQGIIGSNVFELHAHKTIGFDKFLKKGFSGEPFEQDIEHASHTTQEKMWQHYYGVPLMDTSNKYVERLLLIVENATMRKQFEQELEKQIQIRTLELRQKLDELEKFKDIAIGRELKMIELKKKLADAEGLKSPLA